MRYPTTHPGLVTRYHHFPTNLEGKCMCCGELLEDAYVNAGHRYTDFSGDINEIRYLRRCVNSHCVLYNRPYNPTPSEVLPYKQYSLAVWKWIAEESLLYNQNAEQIHDRIHTKFGLTIAVNTIRNYLDEIDILVCHEIDAKTLKLLQFQGIIILALDGQKPEESGKALWLFVDLLSNRILKVSVLESADSATLHTLVEEILAHYHVNLVGMVSDKQNNLVKLHDDWYADIPHQYCHFHFLQNIWNHIEVKDTALRQGLSKAIKNLYIVSVSKQTTRNFLGAGKQPIRQVFEKVELKLRRIVKARTKKFEKLGGTTSYEGLQAYLSEMDLQLAPEDVTNPGIAMLKKTSEEIRRTLLTFQQAYEDCSGLITIFQEIRSWLGKECPSKGSKLASGDKLFNSIWERNYQKAKIKIRSDLRSFLPKKGTSRQDIELEAVRLYDSYREGLFRFYDFPVKIRTNSPMEQAIGQEKGKLQQRNRKANVGCQIRIRGEYELKKGYAGRAELQQIIERMGEEYSENDLKEGLAALAARRHEESEVFTLKGIDIGLKEVIEALKASRDD